MCSHLRNPRDHPNHHLPTATFVTKLLTLLSIVGIWITEDMIEGSVITGTPKSATSSRSYEWLKTKVPTWYTREKFPRIFTSFTTPMYALNSVTIFPINSIADIGDTSLLMTAIKKIFPSFTTTKAQLAPSRTGGTSYSINASTSGFQHC